MEKPNQDYYNGSDYKLQFESSNPSNTPNTIQKSCFERYKDKLDNNDNDNDIKFYIKVFFGLMIQCLIAIFFVWLGFVTGASDAFIKSGGAIAATLTIVSIYILVLCYSSLCIKEEKVFYLHVITYVPCMVFYCFEITATSDKNNIYIVLLSIFLDIFSLLIYFLTFMSLNFIGLILFPLIPNVIVVIIFSLTYLYGNAGLILKIIAIDFSGIIYFNLVFFVLIKDFFSISHNIPINEPLVGVVFFDLAIFSPAAFVLFLIFLIFMIYAFGTSNMPK